MKLTGKHLGITVSAGITGLFAGVLLVSGGIRLQTLALAGLLTAPPVAVGLIVADTKAQRRINQVEGQASDALRSRDGLSIKLAASEENEARLKVELVKLEKSLTQVKELLRDCESERYQSTETISQLQSSLTVATTRLEELGAECEAWEREFHTRIDVEAQRRFEVAKQTEIQRIQSENDEVTNEALDIVRGFRQWAVEVDGRLQDRGEFIKSITNQYNSHLDGLKGSVSIQIEEYLKQIEILNCKVGALQQKLKGDLLSPEYGQFGYAVEGKIANDLARRVWEDLQIPLAVKGYQVKSDGSVDIGYGFSRLIQVEALVSDLQRHSGALAKWLGIYKITGIRKLEIADLIVVTYRREPAVKEDTIKLIAGSPEQFREYVASHPIRYRLIADPGTGKTPITAVMVSEILKVGGTRGNTGKGRKIPNTLVTISCPDVESSQKDADYPLEIFLKYGNTTAAVKSFSDADEDWKYRKRDTNYANEFFQLWVWDELDNTLNNADDPKAVGEKFKNFLKQAHHTGVGWIVSGQSVMTKQIPGFMDDDRELFTQVVIGSSKIRKYLEKYGKNILSVKVVTQLLKNLDDLEPYIEDKNALITDAARLLRLALVLDDKSPKLYFLPNLDSAKFNAEKIEETTNKAQLAKRSFLAGTAGSGLVSNAASPDSVSNDTKMTVPSNPTIGESSQSTQKPHCCHCGEGNLNLLSDGRYRCLECKKRFVAGKVVWK